jgi:hypothetical protein
MKTPKPSDLLIPEKNPITREELYGIIVVSITLILSQNMGIAFLLFIMYNIGIVIGHYLKT